jgi:glycosyltransferase involved in cell wall biosynthesis
MKLLLHSNAPWSPTGYGNQTGLFAPMLAEHYDLAVSSFFGLDGARLNWNGIPVFPGMGETFGNEYLVGHAKSHFDDDPRGGLVFTLLDVWVLNPEMAKRLNMACWVPIDHEPVPPLVSDFFTNSAAVPIAMSRFGEEQLRMAGFDPLYCPHGVDVDTYKPYERREVRKKFGVPNDAFLIGMVAANKGRPSRKCFQQALEAFRLFRETHDEALLYLHTVADPHMAGGEDIMALITSLGIPPGAVLLADQYRMLHDPFSGSAMGKVFSSFDVLLNPSAGEGFGIPVLEAAACGVPSIVTNFSAMPEVAGEMGWHVGCRKQWSGQRSWQMTPDVEEITVALQQAYGQSNAEAKRRSEMVRRHALGYAAPKVLVEHMLPSLEAAAERFEARKPVELAT